MSKCDQVGIAVIAVPDPWNVNRPAGAAAAAVAALTAVGDEIGDGLLPLLDPSAQLELLLMLLLLVPWSNMLDMRLVTGDSEPGIRAMAAGDLILTSCSV